MNQIHYFTTANRWVAIAPGQFREIVTFCNSSSTSTPLFASIDFGAAHGSSLEFYERVENGYSVSNYYEYTSARRKAQAATAQFFGEFEQFQNPSAEVESDLMQGFLAQVRKR